MLALAQACSRSVSMAPKIHDLGVHDIDAQSVHYNMPNKSQQR